MTAGLAERAVTSRKLKVIDIYCRISVDYDGTTRSVDAQEEDCRDAIAEHDDWAVGLVFKDHAKSGWDPKVVREDFNRLMKRLASGESDGCCVYDLTRFTRKPKEGEKLLELAARGIVVASITTQYNLATADGRKQFRDAMTAAAFESDKISERSSRGKRKKARRGKSNASFRGYASPGYLPVPEGWEPGDPRQLVSEEQLRSEQAIVKEWATRLLAGDSMDALARDMDRRGIRAVSGAPLDTVAIRQILERPSLAGLVEYKGTIQPGVRLDGPHALDVDTWQEVQAMFAARKRGRPATRYLLSGIAHCGRCGRLLYGRPIPSGHPYPDGSVRRNYWCQLRAGRPDTGCGRLSIEQRFADAFVKEATIARLSDPENAAQISARTERANTERAAVRATIKRLEGEGVAIASKVAEWGMARVDAAMAGVDRQLARARAELDALEAPDESVPVDDVAAAWAQAEADGNIAELRAMVKQAFPDLTIRPAVKRGRGANVPERLDLFGESLPR